MAVRIAIAGFGKIARDQHLPAIAADERFALAAIVDPISDPGAGVPCYADHREMIAAMKGRLDAIAICTPPSARHAIASHALEAGLDVLLEKPPAATLGEIAHLEGLAGVTGCALFTAWHAQHNPAVTAAALALSGKTIGALAISWLEDVRKWHPDQEWIWQPGGFGVFDPGINALSIATRILPMPLFVRQATLSYPSNKQAPIAASLAFAGPPGMLRAEMDWRFTEGEQWTILVETAQGDRIELRQGGAALLIDGVPQVLRGPGEYAAIYDRFASLIARRAVEVDREPLRIVADAFLLGRRELVDPFL